MCTTSSSRAKPPTTASTTEPARRALRAALALAALAAAGLPVPLGAQQEGCAKVTRNESVVEGSSLHVRGELTNGCSYPIRNVRVNVEALDQSGQMLGTASAFVDPAIIGASEVGRFDVPIATTQEPATVNISTTWRRGFGY